jgi:hypothetical protein
MAEFISIPVLYFSLPIISTLGMPPWATLITCYLISSGTVWLAIAGYRTFYSQTIKWYEHVALLAPWFVWGLVILSSSHSFLLSGLSFYFGMISIAILLPGTLKLDQTFDRKFTNWQLVAALSIFLCLFPLCLSFSIPILAESEALTFSRHFQMINY